VAVGGDLAAIQRDCHQLCMDLISTNERTDTLAASLGLATPIVTKESNSVASSQEEAALWDAENLQRAMTPAPYLATVRPPPLGSRPHLPTTPAMLEEPVAELIPFSVFDRVRHLLTLVQEETDCNCRRAVGAEGCAKAVQHFGTHARLHSLDPRVLGDSAILELLLGHLGPADWVGAGAR
jgi:hypothetical protein